MTRKKRKSMRPGEIFGFADPWYPGRREALIVIDDKTEIGMWAGGKFYIGDLCPSLEFEVLS